MLYYARCNYEVSVIVQWLVESQHSCIWQTLLPRTIGAEDFSQGVQHWNPPEREKIINHYLVSNDQTLIVIYVFRNRVFILLILYLAFTKIRRYIYIKNFNLEGVLGWVMTTPIWMVQEALKIRMTMVTECQFHLCSQLEWSSDYLHKLLTWMEWRVLVSTI